MLKSKIQLYLLNKTLSNAKKSKFYNLKLNAYKTQLRDTIDLQKLPFTTKKELRELYPFGCLAVPLRSVVEMHTSSGTTGKAVLSYFTKSDLDISSESISKAWQCFGINNNSRVQFMMSYGLFSGAAINTYAIQKLGGFVVPAGIQSAEKQIQMMIDFKIDTIVGTPGYYLYLFDYLSEKNISPKKLFLKRGIMAGEIYSDELRAEIEQKFNIKIFDHYGLCEVNTGIAYECKYKNGLHILDEYVFPEIINPKNGKVLPYGSEGELVLTTLKKKASPVIRYRTGDITSLKKGVCSCGRNSTRINRIKKRVDDLIFFKGIKIDPYELKEYIVKIAGNYIYSDIKIIVKNNFKEQLEILISLKDQSNIKFLDFIKKSLKDKILLVCDVKHVSRDYFKREEYNKVKFVEYVDKK
jgi:phenylacetate-CoA ligase